MEAIFHIIQGMILKGLLTGKGVHGGDFLLKIYFY